MTEQTANVQSIPPNPLFEGTNKYLVIILGIFILILLGLSGYIMFVKKVPLIDQPDETVTNQAQPTNQNPLPPKENPYVVNNEEKPFNKLSFDYVKKQVGDTELVSEGHFHGKLLQIDQIGGALRMKFDSLQEHQLGKIAWYLYDKPTLSKITAYNGEGFKNSIEISSLKPGDEVYIDEKLDYSKQYPAAIVSVKITKLP